ncbi:GNAT family acetyltransferase [Salinisphaera shabanensis T35B1]|uniref:GNAT family N-acetyltransferase n=1 Tax=Salinisphaera shabanensis TaxID=180542 RepID=UPI00333F1F36
MPVTSSPTIRSAGLDDLTGVHALEQACFVLDGQSRRSLRHLIAHAHGDFLVAVADGAIVGDVIVLYRRGARVARLYSIAVGQAARGQGMARRLVEQAHVHAVAQGCRIMRAEARLSNDASRRLFADAGYREVARLVDYYPGIDGGHEDGVRLEKYLDN